MGLYLNSRRPLDLYTSEVCSPYFVDKTMLLAELFPLVRSGNRHICVTRPRRFGKSVNAAMIGAFFNRAFDSSDIFDTLMIADHSMYSQYLNQYELIYMDFMAVAGSSNSYDEFILKIQNSLQEDLWEEYPSVRFRDNADVLQDINMVYEKTGTRFILVIDEWDSIFHKDWVSESDRKAFTAFLAALTKGSGCILFTYMTGVLPIAKYSISSTINHFIEYNIGVTPDLGEYFGFTESEVDALYQRYSDSVGQPAFSRNDLTYWYDGYLVEGKTNVYNPRSVVRALESGRLGNYWTRTGQFNEIADFILTGADGIISAIAEMVDSGDIPVVFEEDAAMAGRMDTRDRVLSAMVVYGFLTYDSRRKTVRIPNRELGTEFEKTILTEPKIGYMHQLASESGRILQATLEMDGDTIAEILEHVHEQSPLLVYNSEAELSHVVWLAYLAAQDDYQILREAQGGRGRTDHLFIPRRVSDTGFIIELKMDTTPRAAIQQIIDRDYIKAFRNPLGVQPEWKCEKVLAVGIAYDSSSGKHSCEIVELKIEA